MENSSISKRLKGILPKLETCHSALPTVQHGSAIKRSHRPLSGRRVQKTSRLTATVLSVHNVHRHGELYSDFLKARKLVFIDTKGWSLPHTDGMEFDQYDTPQSRSVIIHEFGQVLGGVRLLPTSARCGCYSYMLRDAQLGLLNDIPPNVLYEKAPVAPHIWEATRLFLVQNVSVEQRIALQSKLMAEMANAAQNEGASHVIGIVPATFQRWLGRIGIGALALGPKLVIDGDNTQAAVLHVAGNSASYLPMDHKPMNQIPGSVRAKSV